MTFFKTAPTVLCMAFLGAAFLPSAKADDFNKKTTITFSEPIEIPGVHLQGWGVLPAGTYVFKLVNSDSDRHIVQIFSKDESTVYATILAIPNYRRQATDKTVVTFNEGLSGRPEAIRTWFYPGANWGEEFVYPKARAVELAVATKQPVPTAATDVSAEATQPEEPAVVAQLKQAPVMAAQPSGEVVELTQSFQTAPPATLAAEPAPAQAALTELPATASSLPLFALCGLMALAGGLALRSMNKRAL
jgi:hypothetical protein